jgi:hypothetical protein
VLFTRYGRPGEGDRVYYPVAALYGAGLWELDTDAGTAPNAHGSSVPQRWFNEHQPRNGLVTPVYELVRDSAEARAAAVRALTETYFLGADHTALLDELGLSGPQTGSPAEAALSARAAEYRWLCNRVDVFWAEGTAREPTGRQPARSVRLTQGKQSCCAAGAGARTPAAPGTCRT